MPWPSDELTRRFARPENAALVEYLLERSPSCHSDLGILLFDAVKRLPGAQVYGPNVTACSYVFAHTHDGVAFAAGLSMRELLFRLAQPEPEARRFADLGEDWYVLDPFDPGRPRAARDALLARLFRSAYLFASSTTPQ